MIVSEPKAQPSHNEHTLFYAGGGDEAFSTPRPWRPNIRTDQAAPAIRSSPVPQRNIKHNTTIGEIGRICAVGKRPPSRVINIYRTRNDDLGALGSSVKACLQKPARSGWSPGWSHPRATMRPPESANKIHQSTDGRRRWPPPGKNELHRRLSVPGRRRRCCRSATSSAHAGQELVTRGGTRPVFITNVND